jgi:dephospho-CoA kinase
MPGAGKTTAYGRLGRLGFATLSMGDIVREEARRRGFGLDGEGQRKTQMLLREEGGSAAIAELCSRRILEKELNRVIVDGVRSMDEVKAFTRVGTVRILCIHASPDRRFQYLQNRGRPDDPRTREEFDLRDRTELSLGVGSVIAMADRMVENELLDVDELQESVASIAKGWLGE